MAKRLVGRKIKVTIYKTWFARRPVKVVAGFFVIILLIIFPLLRGKKSLAEETILYPKACFGQWENANLINGDPSQRPSGSLFARPLSPGHVITCNQFAGDLPQNAKLTNARLEFTWSNEQAPAAVPALEESEGSTIESITETAAPNLQNPVEENQDTETTPVAPEKPANEPISEPIEIKEPSPEPEPAVLPPTSFLPFNIISIAYAQEELAPLEGEQVEVTATELPEPVPLTVPQETLEQKAVEANPSEEPAENNETIQEKSDTPQKSLGTALFDISFTVSDSVPQIIGTIEREYLGNSHVLPITESDIANLSVSLSSLMTMDGTDSLYLSAIKLVVTHKGVAEEIIEPDILIDRIVAQARDDRYWVVLFERHKNKRFEIWYTDAHFGSEPHSLIEAEPRTLLDIAEELLTPGPEIPTEVVEPALESPINTINIEPVSTTEKPATYESPQPSDWSFIAGGDLVDDLSPLGLEDQAIFWLTKNKGAIYMFNLSTQSLSSQSYNPNDGDNFIMYQGPSGEDKKALFDVSPEGFYFSEIEKKHEE